MERPKQLLIRTRQSAGNPYTLTTLYFGQTVAYLHVRNEDLAEFVEGLRGGFEGMKVAPDSKLLVSENDSEDD